MKAVNDYIKHHNENLWDFEVLEGNDFENVNRIHPLKQKDVFRMIQCAREDKHILGLIVFGSAVRFDCHSGSDLDLVVIRDDNKFTIDSSLDWVESELDLIFSSAMGERLKNEIAKTGVIVYRREQDV